MLRQINAKECDRDTSPFVLVKDIQVLLPILESRLPRSAHVYNMALMYPKYMTEMKFYTLNPGLKESTWIVVTYDREDYGLEFNISAPLEPIILSEIKDAFAESALIDWTKQYSFPEIDRSISPMIFNISAFVKNNETSFTPCRLYYLSREEALEIDIRGLNVEIEIKPLTSELKTGVQFMYDTCQHKNEGTMEYLENLLTRSPSVGVYKNDQLISGALTVNNGLMGFLYTLEEFRNRSYGKLSMQTLIQMQAKEGFVPCSAVEIKNIISNEFHVKIGMKVSHVIDYITSTGRT